MKKATYRPRVRPLKSQAHLALVQGGNRDVEIFELHISMQGSPNDFKLRIPLDLSEDLVELSVVSEREA